MTDTEIKKIKNDFIGFLTYNKDMHLISLGLINPTPEQDKAYDTYFLKELVAKKRQFEETVYGKLGVFGSTPHADYIEHIFERSIIEKVNEERRREKNGISEND